ncbi:DUF2071 domain-containing protein [Flavobacterium tegetincola]|uniref:YqjF family protein n=1 Tax=Flavobacterium tegetincola TaxID=150172 RepID=UPI00040A0B86
MKILNFLNVSLILIVFGNLLLGFVDDSYFPAAFGLGAFLLPIFQLIVGLIWLIGYKENKKIQFYFYAVISYFFILYSSVLWWDAAEKVAILNKILLFLLFATPISLAVYFTIILFQFSKQCSFMKAEWNDLLFINYQIDPKLLEKYVPKGTEIDLFNGKCYISLIGFMFENVKVLGIKIPYHVNFEEVNLRFYVKRFEDGNWRRGVVFIKEIVPKHAITFVANTLYNEQYQTLPMRHERTVTKTSRFFKYEWLKENYRNSISVETEKKLMPIEENSEAEFISEHYYGYTIPPRQKTVEYEVKHPRWQQYKVIDYALTVDFELTYGKEFAFLQDLKADSCFVAKGSKISIESKRVFS